jgi:hypothetical protein
VGTDRAAVLRWASARSISLAFSPEKRQLYGPLEYVPVHDLVCKGWSLTLELTLAAHDTVATQTVRTYGNCI